MAKVLRPKTGYAFPDLRELWSYRELFWLLTIRDIKLKYKQTVVGILWVILQPLATTLLFCALFGVFAKFSLKNPHHPYFLFTFAGMLVWLLFSQIIQRASGSLLGDARLISKVYFPRLLIPCASATAVLLDFIIALAVFLLCSAYCDIIPPFLTALFPLVFGIMLLAIGLSAFLAALNVHYRDFNHIIPFMLQLWMYASPLFYPFSFVPKPWQTILALNPLVGYTEGFRAILLGEGTVFTVHVGIAFAISIVIFILGLIAFEKLERTFADVI